MGEITLRRATIEHAMFLFVTRNDPVARENSVDQRPLVYESHVQWLAGKLADENTRIFIAEQLGAPVGYVRFDCHESFAIVSIGLAAEFRGRGLSGAILEQGIAELSGISSVHAIVKPTNIASLKLFERAGFKDRTPAELPHRLLIKTL